MKSNPNATSHNHDLDSAFEQCPLDINRQGVDQNRCILGTIFMTWPEENEIKVIVNVHSSTREVQRFEIFFKTSKGSLSALTSLAAHDEFRLSLYGAELEKLPQIPKMSTLPFKLIFTKGVNIEWKSRGSEQMRRLNTWISTFVSFLCCFLYHSIVALLVGVDEASNPDNAWYGTPSSILQSTMLQSTTLQSKRKQDEEPPLEETRPRQDKEDKKRRRMEAKLQKSKSKAVDERMEVSEPEAPLAAVTVPNDVPQVPPSPPTIISRTSPHEEQLSEGSVDIQADFRAEGVSMKLFVL